MVDSEENWHIYTKSFLCLICVKMKENQVENAVDLDILSKKTVI